MSPTEILSTYESIATITGEMLSAARGSDWDRLVTLEQACADLIAKLRAASTATAMEPELQQRKAQIIHKVLADDAEIREITQPWLAELRNMLQHSARANHVARAYGGSK